ncbi:RloB family protein [Facilibium subflavum]|uniref:RloB family protein n=1 Tax=Facilibium subflavum TaxID=2219058 RepID=UPI000E648A73|nr:RloB family protein [Facilibium subflavum]
MQRRRKPKQGNALRRQKRKYEPYDRVLIICEGEKTEPGYFQELCEHYRLSTANIKVMPSDGSDPMSVVKNAKKSQKQEEKRGEKYDRIYCVFDRDEHTNFNDALNNIKQKELNSAISYPCFEYWVLLHFIYCRSPFERTQNKTAAQQCESVLRKELPDYQKGMKGLFKNLYYRVEVAKKNAEKSLRDAEKTGDKNPSTEVHKLVTYLQTLKNK